MKSKLKGAQWRINSNENLMKYIEQSKNNKNISIKISKMCQIEISWNGRQMKVINYNEIISVEKKLNNGRKITFTLVI